MHILRYFRKQRLLSISTISLSIIDVHFAHSDNLKDESTNIKIFCYIIISKISVYSAESGYSKAVVFKPVLHILYVSLVRHTQFRSCSLY